MGGEIKVLFKMSINNQNVKCGTYTICPSQLCKTSKHGSLMCVISLFYWPVTIQENNLCNTDGFHKHGVGVIRHHALNDSCH